MLQSLADSYARSLDDLERLTGQAYGVLHIIGGGSKNGFLNELTKKSTKRKIVTGPVEGTAIGNLLMQMIGAGEIFSVAEARKIVKNSFEIQEV